MNRSGRAALFVLAAAIAAASQTGARAQAPAAAPDTLQPPVTGSMYNGNNVNPPKLTLQGPLAATFQAQQSLQPVPATGAGPPVGGTGGGASETGRAAGQ